MNKNSTLIRTIVDIGLFAALGFVFDELQGIIFASVFTAGGSIGFAMVAVLIVAYRRGWLPAFLTGLIMGCLDMITKAYFITFWQVLLDYVLPYALVATAGLFKPWFDKEKNEFKRILILCLGTFVGGMLKFLSHFIVGALVWAPMGYEWPIKDVTLYSFAYNIAFTGPSIILSLVILIVVYKRAPFILNEPIEKKEVPAQKHLRAFDHLINPGLAVIGLFLFVFFLVAYIQNYKVADKGYAIKITSNAEAVVLMFTGFLLFIMFGINIILSLKNKQNYRLTTVSLIILSIAHVIYAIARILICYFDDWQEPKIFFIWMVFAFFLTFIFNGLYVLMKETSTKEEEVAQ